MYEWCPQRNLTYEYFYDLIDKERLNKVFHSIISFIIDNGGRTERICVHEKKKYDANK